MLKTSNSSNLAKLAAFVAVGVLSAGCFGDDTSETNSDASQQGASSATPLEATIEQTSPVGNYSVGMLEPFEVSGPIKNEFWEIYETTYTYKQDSKVFEFIFVNKIDHFEESEDAEGQESQAEFVDPLFEVYLTGAEATRSEPISYSAPGSSTTLIGHELDFSPPGKEVRVRSILKDKVAYQFYAENVTDEEWNSVVNSLVTHLG